MASAMQHWAGVPRPTRATGSRAVSSASAHAFLSSYINLTETVPHLHPNGVLKTTGPDFPAHLGQRGGLKMHNLRRVEAGLAGEHLAPDSEAELAALKGELAGADEAAGGEGLGRGKKRSAADKVDGWIDAMEDVQAADVPGGEEPGEHTNAVRDGGEVPVVQVTGAAKRKTGGLVQGDEDGGLDKKARKKAKKDREKAEKREKEERKKKGGES